MQCLASNGTWCTRFIRALHCKRWSGQTSCQPRSRWSCESAVVGCGEEQHLRGERHDLGLARAQHHLCGTGAQPSAFALLNVTSHAMSAADSQHRRTPHGLAAAMRAPLRLDCSG